MERRVLMDATAPLDEPFGPDVPPTSPEVVVASEEPSASAASGAVQALAEPVPTHGDTIDTATPVTFVRLAPNDQTNPERRLSRATLSGAIWDELTTGDTPVVRNDADLFRVELAQGDVLDVDVDAFEVVFGDHTSVLDSKVRIFSVTTGNFPVARELASNDDAETGGLDPRLEFTAPTAGTYYVGIAALDYNYRPLVAPTDENVGQFAQQYRLTLTRATAGVDPQIILSGSEGTDTDAADQRVTWRATDADGDLLSVTATVFHNGVAVPELNGTGAAGEVSFNHLGLGTFDVVVTATDATGGTAVATRQVVVTDDAVQSPRIHLGGSSGEERHTLHQALTWSVAGASADGTAVVLTRDGKPVAGSSAAAGAFDLDALGLGTFELHVTASDGDDDWAGDAAVSTASRSVTVTNAAPIADAGPDLAGEAGEELQFDASASSDPDGEALTYLWSFGDDSVGTGVAPTHVYEADGEYTVTLTVVDAFGESATDTAVVTVEGGRPVFSSLAVTDYTRENEEAVLVGYLERPLTRDATVTLRWGDGTADEVLTLPAGQTEIRATHRYLDDAAEPAGTPVDNFLVTATVKDGRGGVAEASDFASVFNVAPTVTITAPDAGSVVAVGTPVTFRGKFADPGTLDTHTAVWEIDGSAMGMPVVRQAGVIAADRTVATTYAFSEPGVYTFRLTVADDDGGSHTVDTVTQTAGRFLGTVVVYDPSAGFVTGGGWIYSQAGAYRANPAVEGKASFAFVSRYRKGETLPSGQTEFAFRAAGLSFRSGSYDALVVSGSRARYRGTGSLNGVAGYRFTMSLIDGQQADGGGQDKLRLRIWAPDSMGGGIVYDNNTGADDAADPATVIGGGSIVVHAK